MRFFLLLLFFFASSALSAQSLKQWKTLSSEAQENGQFQTATAYWLEVMKLDSTTFEHSLNYAECLRETKDYRRALYYYEKNFKKDRGRIFALGQYRIAEMQQLTGDHQNALRNYKKFYSRNKSKSFPEVALAKQGMDNCSWALKLREAKNIAALNRLPGDVNTENSEFAPAPFNDSIFFYSALNSGFENAQIAIYKALHPDSIFNAEMSYSFPMASEGAALGNLAFSPDKTRAYYSRCEDKCRIYECDLEHGQFVNERVLGILLDGECTASMPQVGLYEGSEFLFYASDRAGTRGGLDIWWSEYRNGKWQAPVNAGDNVNTAGNEITPFFINEELYFSSNAHLSLGGFDILRSKGYPRSFDLPENLGSPINSSYNDLYYIYAMDENAAYFASNRPESDTAASCCNDLFRLTFSDSIASLEEKERAYASLKELNDYLPVTLYFHNDEPNPNTRDITTNLSYLQAYDSYVKLKQKYFKENTSGLKDEEKENALFDIESFFEFYVDKGVEDLEIFQILLLEELERGSSVELTIKGFASPRAESDYNINLTKRRIKSLVNHLEAWNNGVLLPYINGNAENGALLNFRAAPFGEDKAQAGVNDQLNNEKASIYSKAASLERKIEILSVERMAERAPQIEFEFTSYDFGDVSSRSIKSTTFYFTNTGDDTLRIDSILSPCACTVPVLNKKNFAPGESGEVLVEFDPSGQAGLQQKVIRVFSNAATEPKLIGFTAVVQ